MEIGKASLLQSTFSGNSQLKIFRSDLNEEGSFDEAVKGCLAVFHVAAPMEFNVSVEENIGKYSLVFVFLMNIFG